MAAADKSHCQIKGNFKSKVSHNISNIILNQYKTTIAGLVKEDSGLNSAMEMKKNDSSKNINSADTDITSLAFRKIVEQKYSCKKVIREPDTKDLDIASDSDTSERDADDLVNEMFAFKSKKSEKTVSDSGDIDTRKVDRKPFVCTECDFATIRKDTLDKHILAHLNNKPFSCMKCDFVSKTKRDYDRHYRIHTGVKCYPCKECGITFTQNGNLLEHMLTHTGEKLFACSECDESFIRKDSLSKHMNSHKKNSDDNVKDNSNSDIEWIWEDVIDENPQAPIGEIEESVDDNLQDNESDMNNYSEENDIGVEDNENSNDKYEMKMTEEPNRDSTDEEDTENTAKSDIDSDSNDNSQVFNYRTFRKKMKSAQFKNLYACTECEYMCMFKNLFKKHVEKHFLRKIKKRIVCPTCGKVFHDKLRLKRHISKHHKNVTYSCRNCEFKTKQKELLRGHYEECLRRKLLYCIKCDFKSTVKAKFEEHVMSHNKQIFECSKCEFICYKKEDIEQHNVIHSSFICKVCEYNCLNEKELSEHMSAHAVKARFACSKCKYVCSSQSVLSKHMVTHSSTNNISCSECDYKCSSKQYLNRHMLIHSGKKIYKCTQCEYICKIPSILKKHMQTHSGVVKLYACTLCKYVCNSAKKLEGHTKTHLQVNENDNNTSNHEYKCEECDFICTQELEFKNHTIMHENSNKLKCKYCASQFEDKKFLAAHMLSHRTKKTYRCPIPICKRIFSSETYLHKHMEMHEKKKFVSKTSSKDVGERHLDDSLPLESKQMSWAWNDESNSNSYSKSQNHMEMHGKNVSISKTLSKDVDKRKLDESSLLEPKQTSWAWNDEPDSNSHLQLSMNEIDSFEKEKHRKPFVPIVKEGYLIQDVKISIQRLEYIKSAQVQTLFLRANLHTYHSLKRSKKKKTNKMTKNTTKTDETSIYRPVKGNNRPYRITKHVNPKIRIITKEGVKCFACSECLVYFKDKRNLIKHLKVSDSMFSCSECDKKFRYKFNLVRHLNRGHNGKILLSKADDKILEENKFSCTKCNYSCSDNDELELHMFDHSEQEHSEQESFTCLMCTYNSTSKSDFENHLLNHTIEQNEELGSETKKKEMKQNSYPSKDTNKSMPHPSMSFDDDRYSDLDDGIMDNENSDSDLSNTDQNKHETLKCNEPKSNTDQNKHETLKCNEPKSNTDQNKHETLKCNESKSSKSPYSTSQVELQVSKLGFYIPVGWSRKVFLCNSSSSTGVNFDVCYFTPTGHRLCSKPQVYEYIKDYSNFKNNVDVEKFNFTHEFGDEARSTSSEKSITQSTTVQPNVKSRPKVNQVKQNTVHSNVKKVLAVKQVDKKMSVKDCDNVSKKGNSKPKAMRTSQVGKNMTENNSDIMSKKGNVNLKALRTSLDNVTGVSQAEANMTENYNDTMNKKENVKLKAIQTNLDNVKGVSQVKTNMTENDYNTMNKKGNVKLKAIQTSLDNVRGVSQVETHRAEKLSETVNKKGNVISKAIRTTLENVTGVKCLKCDKTFSNQGALRKHMMRLHGDKYQYTCSDCNFSCSRIESLNQHNLLHVKNEAYSCQICSMSFSEKHKLKIHTLRLHTYPLCCIECEYKCNSKEKLMSHMEVHSNKRMFYCSDCKFSSLNENDLEKHSKSHIKKYNNIGMDNSFTKKKKNTEIKCPKCTDTLPTMPALRKHLLKHIRDRPFRCSKCPCTFKRKIKLTRHVMMQHNNFECLMCKYSASTEEDFKRHLELHKHQKTYKELQEQHEFNPAGNIFICSDCDFSCPNQKYLIKHMLTHSGKKSYICFHCEYIFSSPNDLEKHIRMQLDLEIEREEYAVSSLSSTKSVNAENTLTKEQNDDSRNVNKDEKKKPVPEKNDFSILNKGETHEIRENLAHVVSENKKCTDKEKEDSREGLIPCSNNLIEQTTELDELSVPDEVQKSGNHADEKCVGEYSLNDLQRENLAHVVSENKKCSDKENEDSIDDLIPCSNNQIEQTTELDEISVPDEVQKSGNHADEKCVGEYSLNDLQRKNLAHVVSENKKCSDKENEDSLDDLIPCSNNQIEQTKELDELSVPDEVQKSGNHADEKCVGEYSLKDLQYDKKNTHNNTGKGNNEVQITKADTQINVSKEKNDVKEKGDGANKVENVTSVSVNEVKVLSNSDKKEKVVSKPKKVKLNRNWDGKRDTKITHIKEVPPKKTVLEQSSDCFKGKNTEINYSKIILSGRNEGNENEKHLENVENQMCENRSRSTVKDKVATENANDNSRDFNMDKSDSVYEQQKHKRISIESLEREENIIKEDPSSLLSNTNIMPSSSNDGNDNEEELEKTGSEIFEKRSRNTVDDKVSTLKVNENNRDSNMDESDGIFGEQKHQMLNIESLEPNTDKKENIDKENTSSLQSDPNIMQVGNNEGRGNEEGLNNVESEMCENRSRDIVNDKVAIEYINKDNRDSNKEKYDSIYDEQKHENLNIESPELYTDKEESIHTDKEESIVKESLSYFLQEPNMIQSGSNEEKDFGKDLGKRETEVGKNNSRNAVSDKGTTQKIEENNRDSNIDKSDYIYKEQNPKKSKIGSLDLPIDKEASIVRENISSSLSDTSIMQSGSYEVGVNEKSLINVEKEICVNRSKVIMTRSTDNTHLSNTCNLEKTNKLRKESNFETQKKETKRQEVELMKCKKSENKSNSVRIEDVQEKHTIVEEYKDVEDCSDTENGKRKKEDANFNESDKGENSDLESSSPKVEHWKRTLKRRASEISNTEENLNSPDQDINKKIYSEQTMKVGDQMCNDGNRDIVIDKGFEGFESELKEDAELDNSDNRNGMKMKEEPLESIVKKRKYTKRKNVQVQIKKYQLRNDETMKVDVKMCKDDIIRDTVIDKGFKVGKSLLKGDNESDNSYSKSGMKIIEEPLDNTFKKRSNTKKKNVQLQTKKYTLR
ncbi:unnamed protein product, partial [Meganyctiphanes norvegica]